MAVLVLDRVLLVVENRAKALMQVRDVISAVEIVIDIHLPVTVDVVSAALEKMKVADAERSDSLHQTAQEFAQRSRIGIEVNEDKALPGFNTNRQQSVFRTVEVLNALELRHALERAIESIFPAMVGALQNGSL